jgi:transmembrane sensor
MKDFEMENSHKFSDSILEQAGHYLMLLEESDIQPKNIEDFKVWLQESELHAQAFKNVASVWGRMDVLHGLADMFPIDSMHIVSNTPEEKWHEKMPWAQLLVACFAVLFSLGFYFYIDQQKIFNNFLSAGNYLEKFETDVGQIKAFNIVDGSKITVNTDSKFQVEITKSDRTVTLERGEAYFEVEHDIDRYFDVIAGDMIVRAIGTAFSVHYEGDKLEVVVTEGIVELIDTTQDSTPRRVYPDASRDLLRPGQVVQIDRELIQVENLDKEKMSRELTWRQGMLAFEGEPLSEVIEEFKRYHSVNVEMTDEIIGSLRVGGYFHSDDISGMLKSLEENFGIEVSYLDSKNIKLSSKTSH